MSCKWYIYFTQKTGKRSEEDEKKIRRKREKGQKKTGKRSEEDGKKVRRRREKGQKKKKKMRKRSEEEGPEFQYSGSSPSIWEKAFSISTPSSTRCFFAFS
ncbi:hypothetical protein EO95_12000 [Methanosarcina sp. 1.H.T.1A.1]|nr:hypothetical protein EO95_12000 [Methanosarcina sp. 1.H.T.1A.1]